MKKILFPILALILIACSPQVTATSEVTITLTPTIIPTQTPQPPSPAFLDLQEEIAKSDIYTLTPNGLEIKNSDGTISEIKDIKPNPQDGTFTITYEGNKYLVEFVSLDGQILTFKDEDGNTFVFNGENLVQALTQEQLDQMTDEEKLAKAPEKIDDLTKSNISTVKNNLVIYRDEETNAQKVFDLLTGKELTLPEAGIIEFNMKDGTKLEMVRFEDIQEAIDYAYLERNASGSTREIMQHTEAIEAYIQIVGSNLNNFSEEYDARHESGYEVLFNQNNRNKIAFGIFLVSINNNSYFAFYNEELKIAESIYVNQPASVVGNAIGTGAVTAPITEN